MKLMARQCCIAETPARITVNAGACTRVGSSRQNNEDAHYVDSEGHVFVVADGIGGATAGEVASQLAVSLIPQIVCTIGPEPDVSEDEIVVFERIRAAFAETNAAIRRVARQNIELPKIGTTAVTAFILGPRLYLASIGDSRAYLIRTGQIQQLTVDHTMAQALVEIGVISAKAALRHQWRNVLSKFLGTDEPASEPDLRVVDLNAGDQIVLATDGLTDVLDEQSVLQILQGQSDAQGAATALIQAAAQKKARDDATCIVLYVKDLDEPASLEWQGDL
jgi:protein phosphatase